MKVCPTCREQLSDEALFCPVDGTALARAPGDPFVGTVVRERFLVMEAIGKGASGSVYRAEDLTSRQIVALKVLHAHLAADEPAVERFRQVLAALAQIPNEHHLQIIDTGRVPDGRLYVAMEILEGETLAQRIGREGKLAVDQALSIAGQVADGLVDAHARGWAHSDLRPANVYLCRRDGRSDFVKLLDLGLAHLVFEAAGTAPALAIGDARYVAPELVRKEPPDPRTDVYALGVILYEAVAGQPPFAGSQVYDILEAHRSRPPPALREKAPDVPAHVDSAVMRALEKDRTHRWQDAMVFWRALRQPPSGETFRPTTAPYLPMGPEAPAAPLPHTLTGPAPASPSSMAVSGELPAVGDPSRARPRATPHFPFSQLGAVAGAAPAAIARTEPVPAPTHPAAAAGAKATAAGVDEEHDPSATSAIWFAEGHAVSQAAEGKVRRKTGEMPALYERLQEQEDDEAHERAPSKKKMMFLLGGGVVAGVVFILLIFGGGSKPGAPPAEPPQGPPPENPLAPVAAPETQPATPATPAPAPVPDPVFQPLPGMPGPDGKPVAPPATTPATAPATIPAPAPAAAPPVPAPRDPEPAARPAPSSKSSGSVPPRPKPSPSPAPAGPSPADQADEHARAGREQLRRGNYAAAAAEYNKARDLDPNNAEAAAGLGEVAFEQGYYAQAVERLKQAVKLRPRSVRYLVLLGNAYFKLGQHKSAMDTYQRALDIDPGNEEAQGGLHAAEKRLGGG